MLWRAEEHESLTGREWAEREVTEAIEEIITDAVQAAGPQGWPWHPSDHGDEQTPASTLYLGAAGMIWALHELRAAADAAAMVSDALERYRASPDFGAKAHPPSLWMGETGLLVVAARVGSPAADQRRLAELIRENRRHPTWELMWGSPGTMLAARALGLVHEWRESAELLWAQRDRSSGLWTQTLYGRMTPVLGPAHGFAGNIHVLRGHLDEDTLRATVTDVLEPSAMREDGLANWPPATQPLPGRDLVRVQWCHGAPGIICTLGELMPISLVEQGAELIWRAGPLRKGPGLCHGTAGNGFAFLRLHSLTGEHRWLHRARRFAMHAIEQVKRERRQLGRGRYTLFTGDVGVALYLRACVEADPRFPTIDYL